uniref:NADH-ubiquinone oxidoreductase chain 4 n=1 Tax=Cornufer vitianus TaxID=1582976 RepID=A0A0K0LFI8_CORVT|nr:NADH dehydrogenase subunit 4 [Cornufer vitianus]AIZ97083.1 NADH dehydrogenase subunit 4 [Cornufer vitianus]
MLMFTLWSFLLVAVVFSSKKYLWPLTTTQSLVIASYSVMWVNQHDFNMSTYLFIDNISAPLVLLTCWLLPLTLLASQNSLKPEPMSRQRSFIFIVSAAQFVTLMAFTTSDLLFFFILFEASLIPIICIITQWGSQKRRLEAGMYIAIYTMLGAVPLLMCLIDLYNSHGSLLFNLINLSPNTKAQYPGLFWISCNSTFLMKSPMYCLHLWLPKAHVEAPVAGSMILAGTLLKLGGYGILRMSSLTQVSFTSFILPIFLIATFGILATALLCMRQTDLKSLIAMSSISHMNLIIIAAIISTPSSHAGAVIMMISHGLTSSAMFCLANFIYERTNNRSMIMLRGTMLILPLTSLWWLLISTFNMAFPPSINFAGELMIMNTIYNWSTLTFLIVALNLIFTTAYSLYIFWSTQRGPIPHHLKPLPPTLVREHILLTLHILPAALLILKPEFIIFFCH